VTAGCLICAKHRGDGPLVGPRVWEDEHVVVSHRPTSQDGTAVLGYLFVETRRHVPFLDELNEAEATAVALAAWRAAKALRAELGAAHVFSAIVGRAVAHVHQHVFARHPGTPDEYRWDDSHAWPDAPRGGATELAALCQRLHAHFEQR
jgi:ATP adenylyltransferase